MPIGNDTLNIQQKPKINYQIPFKYHICVPDAIRIDFKMPPATITKPKEITWIQEPKIPTLKKKYTKDFTIRTELFDGTAADLDRCLEKTKLAGLGQTLLDVQNKYNINALFLMSIAEVESGYGNAPLKSNKYNVVGAPGLTYKDEKGQKHKITNYKECFEAMGQLLNNNNYKNKKTISGIRNVYCKDNKAWPDAAAAEMTRLSKKIMDNYQ